MPKAYADDSADKELKQIESILQCKDRMLIATSFSTDFPTWTAVLAKLFQVEKNGALTCRS